MWKQQADISSVEEIVVTCYSWSAEWLKSLPTYNKFPKLHKWLNTCNFWNHITLLEAWLQVWCLLMQCWGVPQPYFIESHMYSIASKFFLYILQNDIQQRQHLWPYLLKALLKNISISFLLASRSSRINQQLHWSVSLENSDDRYFFGWCPKSVQRKKGVGLSFAILSALMR